MEKWYETKYGKDEGAQSSNKQKWPAGALDVN